MLEVKDLTVRYGAITALAGVDLTVAEGEFVVLLGRNGAGKSSLLKAIVGQVPCQGRIFFEGRELSSLPPWRRVKMGLCLVPEGRHVFGSLTVKENLELGGFVSPKELARRLEEVYTLFPVLKERQDLPAGTLSGGEQQMLAIARALMARPRLLLLDEPSMGLAPKVVQEIYATLAALKGKLTVLLVEQNAKKALQLADRGYLLENGRLVATWQGEEIQETFIQQVYLGK
ncbi:MAG TPA: ABC transporter ATP-binding protein [Thermodesulfatator atlanticus]|uniref:ABC transporter ATP-binding protein n=1 Tax=Thermodesulfatator atlanticus TaxID=501497 RepID=A0A7V5NZE2_9BACT|nr:ABC transporter ATP-binding protein [Thermodesulfatator atlanticus]